MKYNSFTDHYHSIDCHIAIAATLDFNGIDPNLDSNLNTQFLPMQYHLSLLSIVFHLLSSHHLLLSSNCLDFQSKTRSPLYVLCFNIVESHC